MDKITKRDIFKHQEGVEAMIAIFFIVGAVTCLAGLLATIGFIGYAIVKTILGVL